MVRHRPIRTSSAEWGATTMDISLLRTLRRIIIFGQPKSIYSQFGEPPSPPGRIGLCTLSNCRSGLVSDGSSLGGWYLCPEHYLRASRVSRRKHLRALFWQDAIQKCFSEAAIYDPIVASGRYLKLCTLAEHVASRVDDTWRQVVLEAEAAAGKGPHISHTRARMH
jgi:hypothetical protein